MRDRVAFRLVFCLLATVSATPLRRRPIAAPVEVPDAITDSRPAERSNHGSWVVFGQESGSELGGCSSTDFVANVSVGGAWFELIADTGSSTLAVASTQCSNCGSAVHPLYQLTGS